MDTSGESGISKAGKWTSRWFLLSVVLCVGAFVLAWRMESVGVFTAVAVAALGGGHATNVMERRYPRTYPDEGGP